MKKASFVWLASVLALLQPVPLWAGKTRVEMVNVREIKDVPKQRIYIPCGFADEADVIALRKGLMERGAEKVNLFFSSVIGCEIPLSEDPKDVIGDARFSFVEESALGPAGSQRAALTDEISEVRSYYEMARSLPTTEAQLSPLTEFRDRVVVASPELVEKSRWRAVDGTSGAVVEQRAFDENNEVMIGDILVRLVFPESNGFTNTENWTDDELRAAKQGAASAALAYQETYGSVPMDFVFTVDERVTDEFEPIKHTMDNDADTWIASAMLTLGYANLDGPLFSVHDFNNDGRSRFGTDWVYTAFIADSRNEPSHIFAGGQGGAGYTAYANLGGPYLVIPFPAGENNPNQLSETVLFSKVFQHEMGHIFWALDEYVGSPSTCNSHSGYLDYDNRNNVTQLPDGSLLGCPDFVNCIMLNARFSEAEGRPICRYTEGMFGVIDGNGNSIPDVFDAAPIVEFEGALVETVTTADLVIRMKVKSRAVPNQNPRHQGYDLAAPVKDATINVNGVEEFRPDPEDGRWDETEEDMSFRIQGLSGGATQIQVRARNRFGATSPTFVKTVYYIGLNLSAFDFRIERDQIIVSWRTVGEAFGAILDLYRIDADQAGTPDTLLLEPDVRPENPGEPFQEFNYEDRDIEPGHHYQYFVVGRFSLVVSGEKKEFTTVSETFTAQAMLPIPTGQYVSQVAPNPFGQSTTISIDVPRSYSGSGVDDSGGTFPNEVPTNILIRVYDVQGRLVKTVYSGARFGRVQTFSWDGTNQKNVRVPSGIYFIRAQAGQVDQVRKVVLVR